MYRIICMSASISAFYDLSLNKQCVPWHSSSWTPWFHNVAHGLSCMHVFGINLSLGTRLVPSHMICPGGASKGMATPPDYTIAGAGLVVR